MNVLFLCTGNTCRSPMAETVFLREVNRLGLSGITASSAGLGVFSPEPVSKNARNALAEIGAAPQKEASRPLDGSDLEADHFFVMTQRHEVALLSLGIAPEKIYCPENEISDPYGGDLDAYRRCRDELVPAVRAFLRSLFEPEILPLTFENAAAAAKIERESFETPWSIEALREEVASPNARFFTLSVFGKIAAYAGMHVVLDEAYIDNIAVAPAFRGYGLGRAITQHLISCAKGSGCVFLTLEVRASNALAIRLYESCGFRKAGVRPNFYEHPKEDALLYTITFQGDNDENTRN